MRRLVIMFVVVALSVSGAATDAQAAATFGLRTPVAVTPARGTPSTVFRIGFTTPFATGPAPGYRSWEVASVADRGQGSQPCASDLAVRLRPALAQHRVSVRLSAAENPWCTGAYAGTITLFRSIVCNRGPVSRHTVCPEIVFAPETIGHFRFTVVRAAS